jgi:hypothetical protein
LSHNWRADRTAAPIGPQQRRPALAEGDAHVGVEPWQKLAPAQYVARPRRQAVAIDPVRLP